MAGERLAIQRIFISQPNLTDGNLLDLWLAGGYRRITAMSGAGSQVPLSTPDAFVVFTPVNASANRLQTLTAEAFIYTLQQLLLRIGADTLYTVTPVSQQGEVVGCDIQATAYDPALDFLIPYSYGPIVFSSNGFSWNSTLTNTIRPVLVAVNPTPAGIFGTATGAVTLVPSNGTVGTYTYLWGDAGAPFTASRSGLVAGSYTCTVTDASGASTVVPVVITSDPRLDVLVQRTDNNVTLVPSGGLAPYTYLWASGATTATRLALAVGTYPCTVTDSRGATVQVAVVVDPYRFYWSKNAVTLALDAGAAYRADPTTKPNLSFLCEVWVEEVYRSNVFVPVGGTQEQPADAQGRTVFDARALLDAYLSEHLPDVNQAVPTRADSLFRRFYFKSAEKFGTPAVAAALSSQATNYVVLGGLDFYEAAAGTWFDSYQAGAKPFLTWEPDFKQVRLDQPEYLYFMPDSFTLTAFQWHVRVRYDDGTSGQLVAATVTGVRRFEVYCLPAGYAQLRLGGSGTLATTVLKTVVSWEVWVSDAAGVAQTERRTYVLNRDYVARPRYFLYTNSLGAVSTLACRGDAKRALDVKAEEVDRPQGVGYDPLLGDTLSVDRAGVPTLSVNTGPLTRAQLLTLEDFLLSRRVTLQASDTYFPGKVKAKSVPLVDESGGEKAAEFDFLLPKQRLFTPRLPVTAAGRAVTPVRGGEGAQP